jgi:excisionase family DNA binding protein
MSIDVASEDLLALPITEFCRRVSISRTLAYRLVAAGELRVVKLGTRTVVPVDEVRRRLSGGHPEPEPA